MSVRRLTLLASLAALLLPAAASAGDKLSKEEKKWLEEEVAPIILPTEEKVYRDLKKDDREEFVKIFWARRDTDAETAKPENAFKAEYLKKKAEADKRYRVAGRLGSQTDCGRVFILLGEPDNTKAEQRDPTSIGTRIPETWTYRDKPSIPFKFKDGEAQIGFDDTCQIPMGSRFNEQLLRVAESRVMRPNLDYRFGKDGRLVKLVDLLPKPSPAQALLKEPRQDFPIETQAMFLKVSDGGTALVGLVQGKAEGLSVQENAGRKTVKVTVCAQVSDADGRQVASQEQATTADVVDGFFTASFRLGLKPGSYSLRAGAIEESSKKGSVATANVEAPNLHTGELTAASLVIVKELEDNAVNDPAHPFAAFLLGQARLIPRFGSVFGRSDQLSFFYQYYDAKLDETTGKAKVIGNLQILKGGKTPVARTGDQPFEASIGGTVIGPVPLDKYEPGSYLVQLKIMDQVAKKDVVREIPIEIK